MESMTTGQGRRPAPSTLPPDGGRHIDDARSRQAEHRLTTLETKWDTVIPTLATKSDLLSLSSELKSDMHELRSELKSDMHELRSELKSDMHELRSELKSDMHELKSELKDEIHKLDVSMQTVLHKMEASIHRMDGSMKAWMLGTILAMFVGLGGLSVSLINAQRVAPAAAAAAAPTDAQDTPTVEAGTDSRAPQALSRSTRSFSVARSVAMWAASRS